MELDESDCVNSDEARTVCEDNEDQVQCTDVDDVCCSEQFVKLPPVDVVHGDLPIISNLLSYVVYSLQNSSLNDIRNAVLGFYNIEDVMKAIELLWERVSTEVIGVRPRRSGGSNRLRLRLCRVQCQRN